ncbi:MAG: GxxExxY protein [Planctomycetes bacterium]|nr:GxxExxY protein [Planctomycetota bacterium]
MLEEPTSQEREERDTLLYCDGISDKIIGAAIEVHRVLGPGLLESSYEACLAHELSKRGIPFRRQVELPVLYKGEQIDCGYRIDMLVQEVVVVELKSVDKVLPVHEAQLVTYLRLADLPLGLLLNFNVRLLKEGITRRANTRFSPRSLRSPR